LCFETQAEHFLKVLQNGSVSTNLYLRRIHNFALDMSWLPWPVLPKKRWPAIKFKEKRAITLQEHQAIVEREKNPERKAFYKLAWHLGAAQTDIALLEAENIDWQHRFISFARKKTGSIAIMRFDEDVAEVLRDLPESGPCFRICARFVRATARQNFTSAVLVWASKRSRCTVTDTLGGEGENRWIPGAFRPRGAWPQQQGRPPGLCAKSQGRVAFAGRIRTAAKDARRNQRNAIHGASANY